MGLWGDFLEVRLAQEPGYSIVSHPTPEKQAFKLKRLRKGHDAMGLNQGTPALRNNITQALGHNPQDILVSKSGVATPSALESSIIESSSGRAQTHRPGRRG